MIERIINIIISINVLLLFILIYVLRRWQIKNKKLPVKTFARILTSYFCFSAITPLIPEFWLNFKGTLIVDLMFLSVFWLLFYPFIKWVLQRASDKYNNTANKK